MHFIINGGRPLSGAISINGFKNSATPIIAATLLTDKTCVLENIPRIGDVLKLLEILKSCGSEIQWLGAHSVEIKNQHIDPAKINQDLMSQIRSSILLVGPMLARFGSFRFAMPGGCKIGSRPIDTHLLAFQQLGAEIGFDEKSGTYEIILKKPSQNRIYLKEFSVTATENILMLGAIYPLEIKLAACEPHIQDLGQFLKLISGAEITGLGTHTILTKPQKNLSGGEPIRYQIINDPIEVGTFAVLAAATRSNLILRGVELSQVESTLEKLKDFGAQMEFFGNNLKVNGKDSVLKASRVQTLPYPGLPTDLQAPFGVLATQASGQTLIFDTMYQGRLGYIQELKKMNASAEVLDPHRAIVSGPSALQGARVESLDLRAGATMVIAALVAHGQSILNGIEQIDRGYENIDERLRNIGADIQRIN